MENEYNPDVLSCLANLSNDEVFTPPKVANEMIDLLPRKLFQSPETTFLDIGCKSGVFLREIAKRLIDGLKDEIPDLQKRVDHILHHQLYGIAITELTSLISRRTLYCSKYPNCRYSASRFEDPEGNIRFRNIGHEFVKGRCKWCGASEEQFGNIKRAGLETHAYEFIHTNNPQELFNMKFDVIVGNPPYQIADGGNGASAMPIYHKFVQQAIKLAPRYLVMIIPARWFAGGRGLDEFRYKMLHDKHITHLVDFFDSTECFPGVDISGGICYFLWKYKEENQCQIKVSINGEVSIMNRSLLEEGCENYIRFNQAISIVKKTKVNWTKSFSSVVSSQKPFGLRTYVEGTDKSEKNTVLLYSNKNASRGGIGYIPKDSISNNLEWINKHKVYISNAYGERDSFPYRVIGTPFFGEPMSCCTETYLLIGPWSNKKEALNVISYMNTRFFRFLVLLVKNTQHAPKRVYQFVPMQDFSKPWTDEELYKKYNLSDEEIKFIESMIKPME